MGIFDWVSMAGNYEERKVNRYKKGDLIIDTAMVTDSEFQYETAIKHPCYHEGYWIIVENYDTLNEAKKGHKKWVEVMTRDKPPEELVDVGCAETAYLCDSLGFSRSFKRELK